MSLDISVFICGPDDLWPWLSRSLVSPAQSKTPVRAQRSKDCEVFIVTLYALGTVKGVHATQVAQARNNSGVPEAATKVFVLVDTYTENQYVIQGYFDYVVHPYRYPPESLRNPAKISTHFVPVYAIYQDITRGSIETQNADENTDIIQSAVFVSSHPTEDRRRIVQQFTDLLGIPVKRYGHDSDPSLRSKGDGIPYAYTEVCNAYHRYEYAIVIENTITLGYVSEKLLLAIGSGIVPIYFGAPDAADFVDSSLYVEGFSLLRQSPEVALRALEAFKATRGAPPHQRAFESCLTPFGKTFLAWQLDAPDTSRVPATAPTPLSSSLELPN